jgi:hypothetical protein
MTVDIAGIVNAELVRTHSNPIAPPHPPASGFLQTALSKLPREAAQQIRAS